MLEMFGNIKKREPEIFFSFNESGKIIFIVQPNVNGYKLTSFQNPCEVCANYFILQHVNLIILTR